jgi:acyl-CoA dehydrogenase
MDNEDFEEIRSLVRDFVRTTVVPVENDIDERDEVPTEIREAAKKMGLFGFALPEDYGGLGLSMEEESRIVIELGYTTPALRSMFGTNNGIAGHVLMEGGTPGQKEEWLPKIASGDAVASLA